MRKLTREEFAERLFKAESAADAQDLLKSQDLWDDPNDWLPLGGRENNSGVIHNQSGRAPNALAELITNGIDAYHTEQCLAAGIDPKSPSAPESPFQAGEMFSDLKNGTFDHLSRAKRKSLEQKVGLVVTGAKGKGARPNCIVYDRATGQKASNFADTFCSLNESNKVETPFTYGVFNQGSTSCLQFCSGGMKVTISVVSESVEPDENRRGAITVTRRVLPNGNRKVSSYQYLAPEGLVMTFNPTSLKILPQDGVYPEPYRLPLEHGTAIKCMEVELTGGLASNATLDLYNAMNSIFIALPLPVRIFERRDGYSAHSTETTMVGLGARLDSDRSNILEDGFPASAVLNEAGANLPVTLYVFKQDKIHQKTGEAKKLEKKKYTPNTVTCSVEGQVHGAFSPQFYKRKSLGMDYIASSLYINIDISGLSAAQKESILMASRDRLREGGLLTGLEQSVETLVANHPGLKQLAHKRKQDATAGKIADSKHLSDLFADVLKRNAKIKNLFAGPGSIQDSSKTRTARNASSFTGKPFPTYHQPARGIPTSGSRKAEKGRACFFVFKTDAENEYLTRPNDPGVCTVKIRGFQSREYKTSTNLWNGTHSVSVDLPKGVKAGDNLVISIEVNDISRALPFKHLANIEVVERKEHATSKSTKKSGYPSAASGKGRSIPGTLALPKLIPVARGEWSSFGFDELSAMTFKRDGDSIDFFYNQANLYLEGEKKLASDKATLLEAQFSAALTLMNLAVLENEKIPESEREEVAAKVSESVAGILLPMINSLGELKTVEAA